MTMKMDLAWRRPADALRQALWRYRSVAVETGRWTSHEAYGRSGRGTWHEVMPRTRNLRTPPVNHGLLAIDLAARLDAAFPALGVLELDGALVLGDAGWVFGQDGVLLSESGWYGHHVDEMRVPRRLPRGERLKGTCLTLASDFATGSYGHVLLDCMPRLKLLRDAGFDARDIDWVYCPPTPSTLLLRMLADFGFSADKLVFARPQAALRPDRTLAVSFPGTRRNYPGWVPDFLRSIGPVPTAGAARRLYVSRQGFRRSVKNEAALAPLLARHGFEIYLPAERGDCAQDFADASIVIGPHGGALADLAFCRPGTRVVELLPTDHVHPYYYALAEAGGLPYGYMLFDSETVRPPGTFGPSTADFVVDEALFAAMLDKVTADAAPALPL